MVMDMRKHERFLIHSFARPKKGEAPDVTLDRAIQILRSVREIGFVLAPEVIVWSLDKLVPGSQPLRLLQRRLCLTEVAPVELAEHCNVFGPLALAFDITKVRDAGALPVMYVPQSVNTPLSLIGEFCVNGIHHTRGVLGQLQQLKECTDSESAKKVLGHPLAENCMMTLQNSDSMGQVVASFDVPAIQIKRILQHIGFNNIPFDHSIGVLSVFLNMFCPTDNERRDQPLGYYRQREWRLIGNDISLNGRALVRSLSNDEKKRLTAIDIAFWSHDLEVEGQMVSRQDLAVVYEPTEGWNPISLVDSIFAPSHAIDRVKEVVGTTIPVHELGKAQSVD